MRFVYVFALLAACGGGSNSRKPGSCDGPCPQTPIRHLVVVIQENHTFDTYFANYCKAAAGSAPTCTTGPNCCEAGPAHEPGGATPQVLDDTLNGNHDPDHEQACELAEMDGGKMDKYAAGVSCSDPRNFAYAPASVVQPFWDLAGAGALADRYFQPVVGQSSSNMMYFARAQFVFVDNMYKPPAIGQECDITQDVMSFPDQTLGDLLNAAKVSWSFYAEGYQDTVDARKMGMCPRAPSDCPGTAAIYPCTYSVGDIPIDYYASTADKAADLRDYKQLQQDLDGNTLPQVVFIRGYGYHSEHPGAFTTISDGTAFVSRTIDAIQASDYAPDTLILVTWDEGGGFFDHVAPPGMGSDNQPIGTRVPLLAVGPFARAGEISHVQMDHSSIVKFVEYNWLMDVGQLKGRDATDNNIGSMLTASLAVP